MPDIRIQGHGNTVQIHTGPVSTSTTVTNGGEPSGGGHGSPVIGWLINALLAVVAIGVAVAQLVVTLMHGGT
ncbi:hypothetical protein [Streptosporangium lutulentum]|uniref:Uncharacterized protein n=1 Tax=Streptosporangium lutulentum TaxID=1461250 RepID=A0ABT9QU53_9ACTN|nr:hypothetical protein [Streptosporangium lutulentum]MDP9850258.1 hypothetical protein [Streptosporangium lutulentum]